MKKTFVSLGLVFFSSIFVAGCATSHHAKNSDIMIERIDSSSVKVTHAYITKTAEGLILQGELKRKQHSHAPVPGHVHVELIDSNGETINTIELDPRAKTSSDHIAKFDTVLPQEADANKVKIIHHDVLSHKKESDMGVWQNK